MCLQESEAFGLKLEEGGGVKINPPSSSNSSPV
jgi:hypothetical protein